MTRNWYAVYTRPQKEKKVTYLLNKKGIESFCPVISAPVGRMMERKLVEQPLFDSVVFAYVLETEIKFLLSIPGIAAIAYWRSKPAIISNSEIEIVKNVVGIYSDIKLEKATVKMGEEARIVDAPVVDYNENTISVKYKSVRVHLPSLGFTMIAERIKQKNEAIYPQPGLFTSFPKRINSFFFN